MSDERYDYDRPAAATRPAPALYVLVGLAIGVLAGFALAWLLGGNPLSAENQVSYTELTVASVSEEGDRLCWAEEPERRDSPLQCAILALDPTADVPEEGNRVVAGLVDLRAPDGTELRQVVHLAPAAPGEASPEATSPDGDATTPDDEATSPAGD